MKNVCLYILFLLIGGKSLGQGVDVIFLLDNSASIDGNNSGPDFDETPIAGEIKEMFDVTKNLMESVLECGFNNKVALVQYSYSPHEQFGGAMIQVASDFSANLPSDGLFIRHYSLDDKVQYIMSPLIDILNGIPNTSNYINDLFLNRSPGNKLVVVIITDAEKDGIALSGNMPFTTYDHFKNWEDATIMMIHKYPNTNAKEAGAAATSLGGSYYGGVQIYTDDPYGPGATPRHYLGKTTFILTQGEINLFAEEICELGEIPCASNVILTSPDEDALDGYLDYHQSSDLIIASNFIDSQSVGVYHAEETIVLTSGFHSDKWSVFRAYIDGCSDTFYGRENMYMEEDNSIRESKNTTLFSLAPNPATESVSIKSDKVMATITVTSMQGVVLFNRDVKANSYELNISNYIKGFYVVNVTTEEGQTETQKLIKE